MSTEETPEDLQRQQQQRDKAKAWLEQKWTSSHACPMCSGTNWEVSSVMELRQFNGASFVVKPGPIVPVFLVTCPNCGYVHTVNAVASGIAVQGED